MWLLKNWPQTDIWPNKNLLKKLDSADYLPLARLRNQKNQKCKKSETSIAAILRKMQNFQITSPE